MGEFIIIWENENKALFDLSVFSPSLPSEIRNRYVSIIGYNYLTFYIMQYYLLYSTLFFFQLNMRVFVGVLSHSSNIALGV